MTRCFPTLAGSLVAAAIQTTAAMAGDVVGGKDHPLVGRYANSTLTAHSTAEFDEIKLLTAPLDKDAWIAADYRLDGPAWRPAEGRITRLAYTAPKGRSSLEVIRNHESTLKAKGFELVFSCAKEACYTGGNVTGPSILPWAVLNGGRPSFEMSEPVRYALFKAEQPQGEVHVVLLVGGRGDDLETHVIVLEAKPMEGDKITFVDAGRMASAIDRAGKVDLYGIQFDFDKDTLRAESTPTLEEIAKLLKSRPNLKLSIIGHTDGKGTAAYNLELSRRRAARVVEALTRNHGIALDRLTAVGMGADAPIADNASEAGRARNRRVELAAS